jgi:PAS domain S-box-containing protein
MHAVDPGIFEAWLASTDDGVVAVDAEGRVVLHNPAASRVTGLAPTAAHRRPWRDVLRLDPPISDLLWTARTTGRPTTALASVLCAQGNLRTAETFAHPWTDTAGRTGILILIRDLTALCRARTGPEGRAGYGGMVGADPVMTALYDLVEAVAQSDVPIVIEGEPAPGKRRWRRRSMPEAAGRSGPSSWLTAARWRPDCSRPSCSASSVPAPTEPQVSGASSWRIPGRSCSSGSRRSPAARSSACSG